LSRACAVAELERSGSRTPIGVEGLLPRHLYTYEVALDRVLDLTDAEVRASIGIEIERLVEGDHTTCRALGVAAHALGFRAVRTPSATGISEVLGVFVQNIGQGTLEPARAETWTILSDLRAPT